ncbi:MAG: hypothetical protein ACRDFB_01720 [Rhabdochlamydiaceae bacterium]
MSIDFIPKSNKNYNLDTVIEAITTRSKTENLKVALFVGRDNSQPLPKEEGWLWVSLDCDMFEPSDDNRLHLKMDFNDSAVMSKINQTFNKVIVDRSVVKFFNTPWEVLPNLLVQEKDSELIVEACSGAIRYVDEQHIEDTLKNPNDLDMKFSFNLNTRRILRNNLLQEWHADINENPILEQAYANAKDSFLEQNPGKEVKDFVEEHQDTLERSYCLNQLTDTTGSHLKTLFNKVNLCHEYYPYRELLTFKDPAVFWRMRSPTSQDVTAQEVLEKVSNDPPSPFGILFYIKSAFNFLFNFLWSFMAFSPANGQYSKPDKDNLNESCETVK